jgi:hypothetical protein
MTDSYLTTEKSRMEKDSTQIAKRVTPLRMPVYVAIAMSMMSLHVHYDDGVIQCWTSTELCAWQRQGSVQLAEAAPVEQRATLAA